ncbi:MAG: hypothetical protein GEU90_08295 [Gemmatimonas sp.]|nr:hypothetical protein [Gemmatimonas sp.]
MTDRSAESNDGSDPSTTQLRDRARRSLSALVSRLVDDTRTLLRQELALAQAELHQSVRALARNAALLGIGIAILALGLLLLVVFLVVGLGALLGGEYWLSTLIVGGALVLFGGILLLSGRSGLRNGGLTPENAKQALRHDREWAKAELERIKRDLRH